MGTFTTNNIAITKAWLAGGKIDGMGGKSKGFDVFTDTRNHRDCLDNKGNADLEKIKKMVKFFIENNGSDLSCNGMGQIYYNSYYKFDISKYADNIITKIAKLIQEDMQKIIDERILRTPI